jgi:hypothetical protein
VTGLPPTRTPEEIGPSVLGRSGWWVREQCRRGLFPHIRAAGAIRFTDAHVAEIILLLEQRPDQQGQQPRGTTARRSAKPLATGQSVTQLRARPPRRTRGT